MTYRRPAPTCLALAMAMALALGTAASPAQMPSTDDMARATAVVEPLARQHQVALRIGTLWLAALRERAPLVAAFGRGVCQLGYSAYTPGRDYRWLFPTLTPPQREVWLAGLVQHELAHCLEQAAQAGAVVATGSATSATTSATTSDTSSTTTSTTTAATTPTPAPAAVQAAPPSALPSPPQAATDGGPGQRWHEVLADLAFAVHVDQHSPQGDALIRQLAQLRAAQAGNDPVHNSAAELLCYLRQADRSAPPVPWLDRLQRLRARCWQGAYPAAAGTERGATAGIAPGLNPGLHRASGSGANTGSFSGSARLASGAR